MIIGIDGNEANIHQRVGVGRYAYEVLKHLYKIQNIIFEIYLKGKPLVDMPVPTKNWHYRIVGPKKFWTQMGLPLNLLLDKQKPDVFFTPSHYAPRFSPCPSVISVLDLAYIHYPQMFRKQDLWQLKNWTAYSVKKATRILTISRSTKDDIIKYYKQPADKVVVTYPGYGMSVKSQPKHIQAIKAKYGLKGDYLLSVGTLQPRKNYLRLIESFSKLPDNIGSLVIVGKPGWLYQDIYSAPKKFKVEKRVKFLKFVTDADLALLYQGAKCFVLVSLYEGFGMPVLEAMNYGCPVVVSNVSSLPEVAGQAGVLVDPKDPTDIARGIIKALDNREELVKKGQRQCQQFSWEKCARETLAVLEEVGKR